MAIANNFRANLIYHRRHMGPATIDYFQEATAYTTDGWDRDYLSAMDKIVTLRNLLNTRRLRHVEIKLVFNPAPLDFSRVER